MLTINYNVIVNNKYVQVVAEADNKAIGSCKVDYADNEITISSWFVDKEYQHLGYGKKILGKAIESIPDKFDVVKYIWNGRNEYVLQWMEKHFNAKSLCPIHMLKYSYLHPEDSWDLHVYKLNTEKFMKYFKEE